MATFVKGDWVRVVPRPDYNWEHWTDDHSVLCDKVAEVVSANEGEWTQELFLEIEYRGKRLWFADYHLIKVDNYQEVFSESIHEAVYHLNETEKICKRLRDEILESVFGHGDGFESACTPAPVADDDIEEDWQEVTTKEVIPLPGNGGTMTTPSDPKASAKKRRKTIRKIKNLGKNKKITKKNTQDPLTDSWTLSEEDMKELEDYLDSLPYANPPNQTGDYDYQYGDDDDSDWFT